jgi:hypothetical protein
MEPGAMQRRPGADTAARILAVVALLAGAIVLVVIIANSSSDSSSSVQNGTSHGHKGPRNKYYVVQPGDTFGGIASKEDVPIARLEQLNPNLDTQLLPQKGCVNLVPKGCKVLANGG